MSKDNVNRAWRQAVIYYRLRFGIKSLVKKPWRLIPFLLLTVAFPLIWPCREKLIPATDFPLLSVVYRYTISALFVIAYILLMAGLLWAFSIPKKAKKAEIAMMVSDFGYCKNKPALISNKRGEHNTRILTFYSRGIPIERWEKEKIDIQSALNATILGDPQYGGRDGRNFDLVVITVTPGYGGASRKERIYDNEL